MKVVEGVDRLSRDLGRLFVVIGVFDGLHRGHAYLLDALVRHARPRAARPSVITFDHHPDEVLTGSAPPLLLDPGERLERLAAAGVEITVVQHFDDATRHTPYDAFVRRIAERIDLAGFLMTPESVFGYERRGTPEAVAALGRELGFEVVVVPTLELDGRAVRSTDVRRAIAAGDLAEAERLLGRPYAICGDIEDGRRLVPRLPVSIPPPGMYPARVDGDAVDVAVSGAADLELVPERPLPAWARVVFGA